MIEQCLLCQTDVSQGTNKVKRKKCDGLKTEKVREVLNDVCQQHL